MHSRGAAPSSSGARQLLRDSVEGLPAHMVRATRARHAAWPLPLLVLGPLDLGTRRLRPLAAATWRCFWWDHAAKSGDPIIGVVRAEDLEMLVE